MQFVWKYLTIFNSKIMNKGIKSLAAIVLGLAAVACSSPEKMAEQAENVTVKCNPAVGAATEPSSFA